MRTLIYAMGGAPWTLEVRCQQAGLLKANLLYYASNTSGSVSLRPDQSGKSVTTWEFPGTPPFQAAAQDQADVQVVVNADGGHNLAELLYLELQHWEDPFNGQARVEVDVRQGGQPLQVSEVTISAKGQPVTTVHAGPYVFTTPVAWREAALYFDWRP